MTRPAPRRPRLALLLLLLTLALLPACRAADRLMGDDAGDGRARGESAPRPPRAGTYGPSDR